MPASSLPPPPPRALLPRAGSGYFLPRPSAWAAPPHPSAAPGRAGGTVAAAGAGPSRSACDSSEGRRFCAAGDVSRRPGALQVRGAGRGLPGGGQWPEHRPPRSQFNGQVAGPVESPGPDDRGWPGGPGRFWRRGRAAGTAAPRPGLLCHPGPSSIRLFFSLTVTQWQAPQHPGDDSPEGARKRQRSPFSLGRPPCPGNRQ